MGEIPTQRDDIRAMRGLHLYHFNISNCSQRVRIALEEKQLAWTSHVINLPKNENLDKSFASINPAIVVPVLIHDGRTYTESNDIIAYIDNNFPGAALSPMGEDDRAYVELSLLRSSGIQRPLKLLSHEFLFKIPRRMSPAALDRFERNCPDKALVQFVRDLNSPNSFGEARIREAATNFAHAFADLEQRLNNRQWLTGESFGLADISWLVNVHRLMLLNFPMTAYPQLTQWYLRARARPSFDAAIAKYEPMAAKQFFKIYSFIRRRKGTDITAFI